jgi:predicted transcriptional regulator of viral defense system
MPVKQQMRDRSVEIVRRLGIARARDLVEQGIHSEYLRRLCRKGILARSGRGLYTLPNADDVTENHALAEVSKYVPGGVICLYTALRYHNIGTQNPFEVWMAIDRRAARPRVSYPPLRIVRFSGEALTEGVEEHRIEGVPVRVTNPAKTVADCFKYRNKYGLDVALEALREGLADRRFTMDELWHYAKICRVANVMRPYLEAI